MQTPFLHPPSCSPMLLSLTASPPGSHAHCNPDAGCFAAWFCSLSAPTGLAAAGSSPGSCAVCHIQCWTPLAMGCGHQEGTVLPVPELGTIPCSLQPGWGEHTQQRCAVPPSPSTTLTLAPHPGSTWGSPACCLHPNPTQVSPPRGIPFLQIPRSAESRDTFGDTAPKNTPAPSSTRLITPRGALLSPRVLLLSWVLWELGAGSSAEPKQQSMCRSLDLGYFGEHSQLMACGAAGCSWDLWLPGDPIVCASPVAVRPPAPRQLAGFLLPNTTHPRRKVETIPGVLCVTFLGSIPSGGTDLASFGWEGRGRHHTEVG